MDVDFVYVVRMRRMVGESDEARVELAGRLATLGYDPALRVSFTADKRLAA